MNGIKSTRQFGLIVLILYLIPQAWSQSHCEPGWDQFEDDCLYFSPNAATRVQAENTCRSSESHIITIESKGINDFIDERIQNDIWIGLRVLENMIEKEMWYWSDGSDNTWVQWTVPPVSQPCVSVRPNSGIWDSSVCYLPLEYICKKEQTGGSCEGGWTANSGQCYFHSRMRRTNMHAALDCIDRGATLTSIHSQEENNYISNMSDESVFIGLYPMIWDDESTYNWHNWDAAGPLLQNPCVRMIKGEGWRGTFCNSTTLHFVCHKAAVTTTTTSTTTTTTTIPPTTTTPIWGPEGCPISEGWEVFDDKCYWFSENIATREVAAEDCKSKYESILMTVASQDKYDYLQSKTQGTSIDVWIGLYVEQSMQWLQNWYWNDGSANNWSPWVPPVTTSHPCVRLTRRLGEWETFTCAFETPSICRKEKTGATCEANWQEFNNFCHFVNTDRMSNMDAANDCDSRDASLASIHSEDEHEFLRGMLTANSVNEAWIGYYPLIWEDKTPYNYHKWDAEGPFSQKPCVRQSPAGLWTASYCDSEQFRYACQLDVCLDGNCQPGESQQDRIEKIRSRIIRYRPKH